MEVEKNLKDAGHALNVEDSTELRQQYRVIFNILRALKYIVCSGVFLKGSAFAMGVWNPSKGLCAIMAVILLLLDIP